MFEVINSFKDLQNKDHVYLETNIYPHDPKVKVTKERVQELSSSNNKIGKPLIKALPVEDIEDKYLYAYAKLNDIKIPKGAKLNDIKELINLNNNNE